jgi:hypothetical protein
LQQKLKNSRLAKHQNKNPAKLGQMFQSWFDNRDRQTSECTNLNDITYFVKYKKINANVLDQIENVSLHKHINLMSACICFTFAFVGGFLSLLQWNIFASKFDDKIRSNFFMILSRFFHFLQSWREI